MPNVNSNASASLKLNSLVAAVPNPLRILWFSTFCTLCVTILLEFSTVILFFSGSQSCTTVKCVASGVRFLGNSTNEPWSLVSKLAVASISTWPNSLKPAGCVVDLIRSRHC